MKRHLPTVLVIFLLIAGLSMLFYPDVATWWNGRSQRGMVMIYDEEVALLSQARIDEQFARAAEVNADLAELPSGAPLLIAHLATRPDDYLNILYLRGIMGRVEIPVIGVNLPIFHTTEHWALDRGVGHLEGTSFPIGGYSTHSVLTAHTGLHNARMFSDMEGNVNIGDNFFIRIMGQTFAYEVDQIQTILPHEIESLRIIPGEDLVTLITCTPYAVNSHRLLVRGHRVEYTLHMAEEIVQTITVSASGHDIRVFIFVGLFLLFMLVFMIHTAVKGKKVNNPRRQRRPAHTPVPVHQPAYNAAGPGGYLEGQLIMEDLFNELESKSRATERMRIAQQKTRALKPALVNRHAPVRRNKKPMPSMTKYIAICSIAILVMIGIGAVVASLSQPSGRDDQTAVAGFVTRFEDYNAEYMDRLIAERMARWLEGGELELLDESHNPLTWLHEEMTEHNRRLYAAGQAGIPDPFSYSQATSSLRNFDFEDEEMIGFVTVPSIELELPIYMGASRQNLHRGLAHVTNTSLPVGGNNSNAVIAGYMDLRRTTLLNNIDQISIGDEIHITNFYETIVYTVFYVRQSSSTPADAFAIQSGHDIITLIGYRQGSNERYTVVATRAY